MLLDTSKFYESCVKCGKCIPNCTIHKINADETTSPRGFLDLISAVNSHELSLDQNAKKIFESCFLCTNCVEACPSHIRVDSAIEAVRFEIAHKFGIAWYKRLAFYLLSKRKVLDFIARLGFVFQSCAFKIQDQENQNSGMRAKFSLPLIKKGRFLASLSKKSFLSENPEFIDNGGSKSIGFFVGCLSNYSYTDTAKAVLKIAKELRLNVDLMKDQVCCGAPQYFTGDFKRVEDLAKKNIAYFEKKLENLEAIIVPEATCSAMLNVDYEHFFKLQKDELWAKRAKKVASKIYLATKYFHDFTPLKELLEKRDKNELLITYHDPCHARKMQGVFKEPRALLNANFKLIELSEQNTCCGFGGVSMQLENYEKSLKVGLLKAKDIEKTKASVVSAECSACRMQISNALEQNGTKAVFKSPLELIASSL
ncbi:glycerol-3-phosphate dehydrogenase [Campylobacter sp. MIT 99-7217]|uniref:(Fe-S)-binding protein n=1 Tax=Campylobacter sp. MIT 99-7217 TaxID=535091 RepID=UPI001159263D|nr:(Fe-S)-binding protein [Campylobacter sp. MIT 99-7217]TQR29554.1 glycerol-3-phosphate dehydrogenase [Campylobacter sp. MIT 99-7217]